MDKEIIEIVDRIIEQKGKSTNMVIPVLQAIQNEFNYLPEVALDRLGSGVLFVYLSVYNAQFTLLNFYV